MSARNIGPSPEQLRSDARSVLRVYRVAVAVGAPTPVVDELAVEAARLALRVVDVAG